MAENGSTWSNRALNAALVGLTLVVLVLLYGLASRFLSPRVDAGREANPTGLIGQVIQVEVRNGCGVAGLAGETTRYLRRKGFDVVEVGDYTSFDEPHSLVIDRVGDPEAARKVAAAMGIPEAHIVEDIQLDLYLDASVVIGRDYAALIPFRDR